jgi:hypothetical protein
MRKNPIRFYEGGCVHHAISVGKLLRELEQHLHYLCYRLEPENTFMPQQLKALGRKLSRELDMLALLIERSEQPEEQNETR